MSDPVLSMGTVVDDRYVVQRRVGAGAMGEIYLALQRPFMRRTALKILHPWHVSSDDVARRFMQEAEALSRLSHPNTVTVLDFGRVDGRLYIAMEFVEGVTVGARIRENGPLPPEDAIPLAIQVAQSLSEAHAKGIIHRDLKPDNILLSSSPGVAPFVKVVDFGIAKILDRVGRSTQEGSIVGTPHYMAPEQASDRDIGPPTDLYSLACCLFEMLTGQPPFLGDQPMEILVKHQTDPPPRLPDRFPNSLADFLERSLSKKPADRPADAAGFAAELLACSTRIEEWRAIDGSANDRPSDVGTAETWMTPVSGMIPPLEVAEPVEAPVGRTAEGLERPRGMSAPKVLVVLGLFALAAAAGATSASVLSDSSLRISTVPEGAIVEVDGEPVGVTPLHLPRSTQGLRGRIRMRGYRPTTFSRSPDNGQHVFIKLERATVSVRVQAPVQGMKLSINGNDYGQLSTASREFVVGWPRTDLRMVLAHPEFADFVEVVPSEALETQVEFAPRRTALVSASLARGAEP